MTKICKDKTPFEILLEKQDIQHKAHKIGNDLYKKKKRFRKSIYNDTYRLNKLIKEEKKKLEEMEQAIMREHFGKKKGGGE